MIFKSYFVLYLYWPILFPSFIRKSNHTANSNCDGKVVACSLYELLHWDELLTHDRILRSTTEWLILHFYCNEYEWIL